MDLDREQPMTAADKETMIREAVRSALEECNPDLKDAPISDTSRLRQDPISLDSLDVVELLVNIQDRLNLELDDDEDLKSFATVGDLVRRLTVLCA
jgi:acyl carrier protein